MRHKGRRRYQSETEQYQSTDNHRQQRAFRHFYRLRRWHHRFYRLWLGTNRLPAKRWLSTGRHLNRWWWPGDLARIHHGGATHHHVFHIDQYIAVFFGAHFLDQVIYIGRIQLARLRGETAGQIGITDNTDAVFYGYLAGHRELAVTSLFGRQINYHTTIAHAFHHCTSDQLRRGFPGDQCGGNNDIDFFCLFGEQCHLGIDKLLAHHLRITAFATAIFFELKFEKFRIHALNLVFNLRSRVKSSHDCTQ